MGTNNLNNPHVMTIPLGDVSASAVLPAGWFPKKAVLLGAAVINGAALAQSDTNYVDVKLKSGSTVLGELSTKVTAVGGTAANAALADKVAAALGMASAIYADGAPSDLTVDAGASLVADITVGGSGALAKAMLQIHYYPL